MVIGGAVHGRCMKLPRPFPSQTEISMWNPVSCTLTNSYIIYITSLTFMCMHVLCVHSLLMDLRLCTWTTVMTMNVMVTIIMTSRSTIPPATPPMMMYSIGSDWGHSWSHRLSGWINIWWRKEKRNVLSSLLMNIEVLHYEMLLNMQ